MDRNPFKQGKYRPGTHIPIHLVEKVRETKPDYLLLLLRNLKDEVIQQMACIRERGGLFIDPIQEVRVCL